MLEPQIAARLGGIVHLEPGESRGAAWSFVYFFAVLTAYYIVRPVRDELGVMLGPDALKDVFGIVFLVMLAAVPVFGWIVTAFDRHRVVPIVYLFFAANLVLFWLALHDGSDSRVIAKAFFVWVSVFNLFVVSLFWSVMASIWSGSQAKRLFGVEQVEIVRLTGPSFPGALAPSRANFEKAFQQARTLRAQDILVVYLAARMRWFPTGGFC